MLAAKLSKDFTGTEHAFPSKGHHPSFLRCRTGAKCPLQVFLLAVSSSCQWIFLKALKLYATLAFPRPKKKKKRGKRPHSLTHRWAKEFGKDQYNNGEQTGAEAGWRWHSCQFLRYWSPLAMGKMLNLKSKFLTLSHMPSLTSWHEDA